MKPEALLAVVLALSLVPACAGAQAPAEKISFRVAGAFAADESVAGVLRIPKPGPRRLPAVVIVNSSPGFDGRSAFYAEALHPAGMATLEIDMFQGKGIPATPRHNLPHVFQALAFLAAHPAVDPARVGIMGFSWGGIVSILSSSEELARRHSPDGLRFAAHLALYPICWKHEALAAGKPGAWKELGRSVYRRVTGRPVHILAGEKDDYDEPDSCDKFVAALPAAVRPHFSVSVYPAATFAWDSRFSSAPYEAGARKGKGGIVQVVADPELARQSREFSVAYFRKHLAAE